MRILAVTNMFPTSSRPGQGTYIQQQVSSLRQLGLDIKLLFMDRRELGMKVYAGLPDALRAALDEFRPEIVHSMYGGIMAGIVTRAVTDRPALVTFHGSDLLGENLSGVTRKLLAAIGVCASRRAAKQAARVIVVSNNLRDALPKSIPPDRIHTVPCGIDLEQFRPLDRTVCREALGWSKNKFHVLFTASNGDAVKRPALAQAAVDELNKLGVSAELHRLHGIPYEQVPVWMNASHLVLLTSRHEGSPTVVKEALACDVPVVSVDVGDVAARVGDIEGCFIAAPDPRELADKMARVCRRARRITGRSKVQEFSLERIALRIKQIYEAALNRQGPAVTVIPARKAEPPLLSPEVPTLS